MQAEYDPKSGKAAAFFLNYMVILVYQKDGLLFIKKAFINYLAIEG